MHFNNHSQNYDVHLTYKMTLSEIYTESLNDVMVLNASSLHSRKDASDVNNERASEEKECNVSMRILKKDPTQKNYMTSREPTCGLSSVTTSIIAHRSMRYSNSVFPLNTLCIIIIVIIVCKKCYQILIESN